MSALVVVQARMGSTRFPGKVLEPLAGRPLLGFMLERLAPFDGGPVVVATSDDARDDPIAALARDCGVDVVRDSESDVLSRFVAALDAFDSFDHDTVVRLTADCPLADPLVVGDALALHARTGAAYTSNTLLRTFPDGLDVEVITASALREAAAHANGADEREHVTPYLQRRPDRYPIAQLDSGSDDGARRWTIDEPADLAAVRTLVSGAADPVRVPWRDLVDPSPAPGGGTLVPARATDDLPAAPDSVRDAAREWFGGGGQPFARVYTDRAGAWIALEVHDGRALATLHPESERERLLDEVRAVIAADRQIVELSRASPS